MSIRKPPKVRTGRIFSKLDVSRRFSDVLRFLPFLTGSHRRKRQRTKAVAWQRGSARMPNCTQP